MKNLKKVLALVLVIASLMGMATMASATKSDDYSDADSITHIEAVDVMSTIGVFDGISGAFSGDSILTREQAAKIITYMILGKDDADALVASVAPYTDVSRDRWSAGSIAYCKNEGILAGVGNGRFEPDGKLTGVAFAKMCLVALGYDPAIEKLVGSDWAVNTSKLAIAGAGITGNLSQVSLADEMSREDACQMAFNTLKADMVDYDDRGTNITINGATIATGSSKAKPVSHETGWADTGRDDGNIDGKPGGDKIQQFAEKYFTKLVKRNTTDSFGRPSNVWRYKSEEIGTYVRNSELIQTWTAKAPKSEMQSAIGGSVVDDLKVDPTKLTGFVDGYEITKDVNVYFDKKSTAAAGAAINSATSENIGKSGNGVLTELYKDDNGNVTIVMINTYLVRATADYNTVNERVNIEALEIDSGKCDTTHTALNTSFLPNYISNDDFDVTGVKEGDYLLVTAKINWKEPTQKASLKSVVPATLQTGNVTEYTEKDNVTVGGTKYSYNQILGGEEKNETFAINSDATLVLDTYGYIMYVDDASSTSNFVYIDDFNSTNGLNKDAVADAYFADGTTDTITITKVIGKNSQGQDVSVTKKSEIATYGHSGKAGNDGHLHTRWYTYSGVKDGQYTLRNPSDKRYSEKFHFTLTEPGMTGKLITNGAVSFMRGVNGLKDYELAYDATTVPGTSTQDVNAKANNKTVFVIKDKNDDVTTYTGIANVPDVTLGNPHTGGAKVSWINDDEDSYACFVFVDVSSDDKSDVDGGSSVADYMFVLKETKNETHVDGMTYYKYTVIIDGKEEERWIASHEDVKKGELYYNVKEDGNGRITSVKEVGTGKARQYKVEMKGQSTNNLVNGAITHSGGVLDVAYSTGKDVELIVGNKSNINLVIGKNAHVDLLDNDDADYEYQLDTRGSNVGSFLSNYALEGVVYYVTEENDNTEIETMWIYVTKAIYKG